MATYQIPAPPPISLKGDLVENWKDLENSWGYYVITTDLRSRVTEEGGKEIVAATLCTVMGPECKKVMNSLPTLTAEHKKDPIKILDELQQHFIPQRNVLYERFTFNSATQKHSETTDEFVVPLRQLAESCEFDTLKNSLIRDCIVIGTKDERGRERLLRERPVPNLERVVKSLLLQRSLEPINKQSVENKRQMPLIMPTNDDPNPVEKPILRKTETTVDHKNRL